MLARPTWRLGCFSLVLLALVTALLSLPRQAYIFRNLAERFTVARGEHIVLLGRPGPGYDGAENTDSIILLSIRGDQASLIYIPRDLLVSLRDETYKINSLLSLGFRDELLAEISRIVGFSVKQYVAYDLRLVRRLIDAMGGIEVELTAPVTDAVSGYTLGRGRHRVNGEWAEFIIRSRHAPDGDFFRMRNQFAVVRGLRQRLTELSATGVVQLIRVFEDSSNDYETNLSSLELLNFPPQLRRVDFNRIEAIILGFSSGLWQDGSFLISLGAGAHGYAYGLVPRDGPGAYRPVQQYIRDKLRQRDSSSIIELTEPIKLPNAARTIIPIETKATVIPRVPAPSNNQ